MSTYRRATSQRTARRRITRRRHLDLVPTVTADGQFYHRIERAATLRRQRYQTGPRYGQELADERKTRRETAALRPEGQQ